jgi:hypothetical protein
MDEITLKHPALARIATLPEIRVTQREWERMDEYSATLPTGIYNKRWKRLDGAHDYRFNPETRKQFVVWMVGEYKILREYEENGKPMVEYQLLWYRPIIKCPAEVINV